MTDQERISELRLQLHHHNEMYYLHHAPEISDQEFDALMRELQQLEKQHPECADPNSPSVRVGSDLSTDFQQVTHRYPMLSLANTYNAEDLQDFYSRVSEGLGGEKFDICCELKFDGLSISLQYENGELVRAVTRGDGLVGDDVTQNVRTIRTIPLKISRPDLPSSFEVRGEVLMPWDSFEQLNQKREAQGEQLFANPRNAASGTLKSKSSAVVANRKLDAYFYYMKGENLPTYLHEDSLKILGEWGFQVGSNFKLTHSLQEIYDFIEYWDKRRSALPFATDGVVLKVNDLRQQERLGMTAKNPRWAIAYKFQAERARTRLKNVIFQVGRTGAVTPVADMEPVLLAGTVVKRASLHNADIMRAFDLHYGDWVYVEKAGEIIPQIVGVDVKGRDGQVGDTIPFITTCPECGTPLVRYEGEAASYCPNDSACPPQIKGRIEHFISRDAMNIEFLGPETVDEYLQRGWIQDAADLYNLQVRQLGGFDGSRIKSAKKIIDSIDKSRQAPFERSLYALGIRFVGKVVAKMLARHFHSIDALQEASLDDLMQVDGVGQTIAESVLRFFADERNRMLVGKLQMQGVNFLQEEAEAESDRLQGKIIVISGTFAQHGREEYKQIIEKHGGKNSSNISSKTTFVLAGNDMGPAKRQKAEALGIPLLSEEDFLQLLED